MSFQKNKNQSNIIITAPDKNLILVAVFLVVIGIMSIFSATSTKAIIDGHHPLYFLTRQLIWLALGLGACVGLSRFDYKKLKNFALPIAWVVVVLLILTNYTSLGVTVNGARRWLNLGVQFQPSEFSKPAVILCLANIFSKNTILMDRAKIPYYIIFLAILFLIITQPNLSMTVLLAFCMVIMYFCAGGSFALILTAASMSLPVLLLYGLHGFQKQRIMVWLDPKKDPSNAGYNIVQSLIAFTGGSFFGVGYGNSKQKLSWLPEGHTDFIFSIIGEEFGFLGCILIIGLFLIFLRRGVIVAMRVPDMFGKLLAMGISFSITVQAFINMGVASGFLPASGIPLPFISYGGTSLFVSLCMLGILLNISKVRVQKIIPKEGAYEE